MNKTLIQWQEPEAVRKQTSKELLKGCWVKITRVMIIAIILATIVYFAISKFPLEESFLKMSPPIFLLGTFCFLIIAFIFQPYLIRFIKQTYKFTEKGIMCSGNKQGFFLWDKITDYSIKDSTEFPGLKSLTVIYQGRQRTLFLSDELPLDEVLTILSTRITKRPTELKTKLSFTKAEYIYMFIFCLACSALLAYFVLYQRILGQYTEAIVLLMFFGPGNLVILQLK